MAFTLRPYQHEAIAAVLDAEDRGQHRVVVVLPTGAGKTVVFSNLTRILRRRTLVLAHRAELLAQAKDKLERVTGRAVALEMADARAPDDAEIVVASLRSLRPERLARLMGAKGFGLVIYDECHHAPADDNQRILRALGAGSPTWQGLLVGFTATTGRGDRRGLEEVFDEIVYHRSLPAMIRDGYLAPLRGLRITTGADLRDVAPAGADLDLEALEEAVDVRGRNALVARSIQELCRDRKTLVFCVTVQHARNLCRALQETGVSCAVIHGELPSDERAAILGAFRDGALSAITNVGVLTEGFDEPSVSCVAMARPTRSESLYAQCVGRGTRLLSGKPDCLVLDFVDLSDLSLVTLPSLFGLPSQLDLAGDDPLDAEERLGQIFERFPTFEVPPESITLLEIEARALTFDPLTRDIDPEVAAISPYGWTSLGRSGLILHALGPREQLHAWLILDRGRPGRDRYHVFVDERPVASFARLTDAVEACDHDVERRGPSLSAAALPEAPWRRTRGEAVAREAIARYARRSTRRQP